jgi:hypothetical protein
MFLRYFIELPLPAQAVEQALLGSPATWLPRLADQAGTRGQQLLAEVGVGPAGRGLRKRVQVTLGPVVRHPSRTTLAMTWQPTGPGALFPVLEAELEVGALGAHRTQLALNASYRPPPAARPPAPSRPWGGRSTRPASRSPRSPSPCHACCRHDATAPAARVPGTGGPPGQSRPAHACPR